MSRREAEQSRGDPPGRPLPAQWFARDAWEVAPDLLNKVVAVRQCTPPDRGTPDTFPPAGGWRWARVVEVEAYGPSDPASHSVRGQTKRNAAMFGAPGRLYVYLSYGVHWCANVVTGPPGSGQAVLLRGVEPLGGFDPVGQGVPGRDGRGPGRLTKALGVTGTDDGATILGPITQHRVVVLDDGVSPPASPGVGPRVGITKAVDLPWRWWVADSKWVSGPRAGRPPAGVDSANRTK